jgi:hypothetical protein
VLEAVKNLPRTSRDRIPLLHALMAAVGEVVGAPQAEATEQSQADGAMTQTLGDMVQSLGPEGAEQEMAAAAAPDAAAFAHAFIGAARALDIPTRFVTGYFTGSEDFEATFHAWAEAYDDGLGWIGFDPMLGYCPAESHIRVAAGLDALTAAPVRSVPALGPPQTVALSLEVPR